MKGDNETESATKRVEVAKSAKVYRKGTTPSGGAVKWEMRDRSRSGRNVNKRKWLRHNAMVTAVDKKTDLKETVENCSEYFALIGVIHVLTIRTQVAAKQNYTSIECCRLRWNDFSSVYTVTVPSGPLANCQHKVNPSVLPCINKDDLVHFKFSFAHLPKIYQFVAILTQVQFDRIQLIITFLRIRYPNNVS